MKRVNLGLLKVTFLAILAALGGISSASAYVTPRLKPPAPGPAYLSQNDYAELKAVSDAIKKKQFAFARAKIAMVRDPIAKSLGEWMYFAAEDPSVSISAADAFLDAHPEWPSERRIRSHVEKRLKNSTPANEIFALFESREPITGEGKIQLARAHYSNGAKDAGDAYLKDAWINHNFQISHERRILSSYSGKLTKEDHAARVDRLLWGRQVTNARRVFSRLSSTDRKAAEARAAFLMRAASAPTLYTKLSQDQQLDSGVLHAAVRYYRRTGDDQFAVALSEKAPTDPVALRDGKPWWYERQLLMRGALKDGRFHDAYKVSAHHGLEPGSDFAEAEFNAGWIALRFLNEPERAEKHFLALAAAVATPISISRAYYWLGRSAEARNDVAGAEAYYKVAARHYYSYYGQLAAEKLGGQALTQKFDDVVESSPADRALFSSRPTVAALRMLADLDLDYEFMVFAYHTDDLLERPGEFIELGKLTNGQGAPHLTVRAGKVAVRKDAFAPDVSYPLVFIPDETRQFVAPEIVLGLSRQESEFNPRAFSHAGARGMMQLIPTTAQITARKEGLRYSRSALLDDPVYNMTIGSAHLSHLLDRFDGSLIMTFAAYNAGRSRVDRWSSEYGDPRSAMIDPIDWVELIPFSETRNYVMRVLENVQVYRGRLQDASIPGRLARDLERGGTNNRVAQAPRPALITVSMPQETIAALPANTAIIAETYRATKLAAMLADPNAPAPAPEAEAVETREARATTARERRRASRRNRDAQNNEQELQAPVEKTDIVAMADQPVTPEVPQTVTTAAPKTENITAAPETAPALEPAVAEPPVNTLTAVDAPKEEATDAANETVEAPLIESVAQVESAAPEAAVETAPEISTPSVDEQPTAIVANARIESITSDARPAAPTLQNATILDSDDDFDNDAIAAAIAAGEAAMARERAEAQLAAAARDLEARRALAAQTEATPDVATEIAKDAVSSIAASLPQAAPPEANAIEASAEATNESTGDQCQTARDSLSDEDAGEPRAADLNAAMLAELQDEDGC